MVARIGAPSLADYRRAYAGCGAPWPGDDEIRRRHPVADVSGDATLQNPVEDIKRLRTLTIRTARTPPPCLHSRGFNVQPRRASASPENPEPRRAELTRLQQTGAVQCTRLPYLPLDTVILAKVFPDLGVRHALASKFSHNVCYNFCHRVCSSADDKYCGASLRSSLERHKKRGMRRAE